MQKKTAIRLDPKLWEKIKEKYQKSSRYGGVGWNARKAQLAVKEYKSMGGRYSSKVSQKETSLNKWTREKWNYVGKPGRSRYLPENVRKILTPREKRIENRKKGDKKGQKIKYSPSVDKKMKKLKIY